MADIDLKKILFTDDIDFIQDCMSDSKVIEFVRSKFKRMSRNLAIGFIPKLLGIYTIKISLFNNIENTTTFLQYNKKRFDENNILKEEFYTTIKRELKTFLAEIGKEIPNKNEDSSIIKCMVNKNITFPFLRKSICDEYGDIIIDYNWDNPDLFPTVPKNTFLPQRCKIQISNKPIRFDYPVEFQYVCSQCRTITKRLTYQVQSTNNKLKCNGIYNYLSTTGEPKSKICGLSLQPDEEITKTAEAFFFEMSYNDEEKNTHNANAFSFKKISPGFYDAIVYKIPNPKKLELFLVVSVKPTEGNEFIIPEQKENENFLFTFQQALDGFIEEQTNVKIFGLNPIKVALLMQKTANEIGLEKNFNCKVVGDPSTGKSLIFDYYCKSLDNNLCLSSDGNSISIPALRGTNKEVMILGKRISFITMGYFGSYKTIILDEAGENILLTKNLKTFLQKANYSYCKAGADGNTKERTTHVNLTQNLDETYLRIYINSIRKAYRELNIKLGDYEKINWNESWNLFKPIYEYVDNPYLLKVIDDQRTKIAGEQRFWIDNFELALHQRFPFNFFLTHGTKENLELLDTLNKNSTRKTISEHLLLEKKLKSDNINNFFKQLKPYFEGENEIKNFEKVNSILSNYGLNVSPRERKFFHNLIKISRIFNMRHKYEDMDFDLLKFMIENMGVKLNLAETNHYNVKGVPDLKKLNEIKSLISNCSETTSHYGLPGGEFE